jgi:hypothetical protein
MLAKRITEKRNKASMKTASPKYKSRDMELFNPVIRVKIKPIDAKNMVKKKLRYLVRVSSK